jgi:replicative DNA helicase
MEEENYEFSLVGLLIKQPDLLDYCQLITNYENPFQSPKAGNVFKNIQKLYNETGVCDRRQLMKMGQPMGIELEFYSVLSKNAGFNVQINELVGKVHNYAVKRSLSNLGHKLVNCIEDDLNDASEFLRVSRELIDKIDKSSAVTTGVTLPEAVQQVYEKIEKLQDDSSTYYIKTGIMAIDRIIQGFEKKTLSVFAARPSVGKTAGAITMMSNMTANNIACGFISVEMSESQIIARLAQVRSNVSIFDFSKRDMSPQYQGNYTRQLDYLAGCQNTQVVRTTSRKISNIRAIARKMKNNNPELQVIFIDYMQKVTADDLSLDTRTQVSQVSAILTDMATDLDVHICALAQLNRAGNDQPKIIHLAESGAIERDASYIFLLHRELNDQHQGENDVDASIAVAKNRDGRTGIAQVKYNCRTTRFYDYDGRTI